MQTYQLPFADLTLGATPADTCRAQAAALDFETYFDLARTRDVDQAFWRSLLPADGPSSGVALILETRLGTLSSRLSPYFKTVIAWHASAEAAANTQQYVDKYGLSNIRIIVAQSMSDVDIGNDPLAAVIFYGLSSDVTRQWGDNVPSLLESVLRRMPDALTDIGVVVIGENNSRSYKQNGAQENGGGRIRGISLPGMHRKIRRIFSHTDIYVGSSALSSEHVPPPDFVRQDAKSVGAIFPKDRISGIKNDLLSMWAVRLFWPSFLLVAAKHPFQSMFEEALHQPEVLHQLSWKAGDKFNVKRIVAGNLGTTIAMVGPTDHDSKDVYVRFPSVDSARALCRTNSRALKKLATTSLAAVVPRIMYEGSWKKQDFTIESRCPGQQVFYSTRDLDRMVRESCSTLLALQKQTTKPTVLVDADFDKQVAPLIQDIASYCNADVRDRLDKFARALRSALIGCEVSLGYTHGDFKIGNILVDRGGNLSALIDWDGFTESGFQIFDYLTLLTYKLSAEKSRKFPSVYLEYLLPWKLPPSYASLVEEPVSALAGNKNSFLFMRIVFWFSLISNRFDPVYKYHADWQSEFLLAVLPSFESLCESGWKFSTSTQPEIQ